MVEFSRGKPEEGNFIDDLKSLDRVHGMDKDLIHGWGGERS